MSEIKRKRYAAPKKNIVDGSLRQTCVLFSSDFWRFFLKFHFRRKVWCWCVHDECLNPVSCTLLTVTCHSSIPLTPVLCDPDVQRPAPALLPCPLRPVSAFICASQVTKRPSQWINIKILFRGIRLGNILPSNAALARAKARQGINY